MAWEDFWWETHQEMKELNLQKEFNDQLQKMDSQDKWRYKDTRSRWEYAANKVKRSKNDE